jgi:serine protease inhibitor
MMPWSALVGILLVGCPVLLAARAEAAGPAGDPARGLADLGWELVRRAGEGNVVVSPLSIWEALAMMYTGARGDTASEIAAVLGMPDDAEAITSASQSLRETMAVVAGEGIALDVANRLWVQRGKVLEEPFAQRLESRFGAPAGIVDFASDADGAREEINRWVSDRTASKIAELLEPGVVDAGTRVLLTNAIYMKAAWAVPFEVSATRPAPFFFARGESVDVPFMHRTAHMRAGTIEGATIVEIPYAGDGLAMMVAVPDAVDGAEQTLAGSGEGWHSRWSESLRRRRVALALPRFTARKSLALGDVLRSLGMRKAFEPSRADLSGIDGSRDLFVSAVVHQGLVEVTEAGTEAAAATGGAASARSAIRDRDEPLVVKADRPFVWAIVARGSGAMLFAGIVRDPRAASTRPAP